MSVPEITPELLRRIVNHPDAPHDTLMGLKAWADRMEREQADEKRIDELAEVLAGAMRIEDPVWTRWSDLDEEERGGWRAGIRAVLAAYDPEGRLTAPRPYDQGGHTVRPVRQWGDLRDVPADVTAICTTEGDAHRDTTAKNGWRWTNGRDLSVYALTAFAPYTEIVGGDQ